MKQKKTRTEIVMEQTFGVEYKQTLNKKTPTSIINEYIKKAKIDKDSKSENQGYYCLSYDYYISKLEDLKRNIESQV